LGDSITKGHAPENKENRYSTLVSKALGMEETSCGITGTLSEKADTEN
jgi:hypothetical protein